jgi:hypothetical protein
MSAIRTLVGQPAIKSIPATNATAKNILPDLRIMDLQKLGSRISVSDAGFSLCGSAKIHVKNKYRVHRLWLAI